MAENRWHRYDMKKLRHCRSMYRCRPDCAFQKLQARTVCGFIACSS